MGRDVESREIRGIWFWFFGWLFNMLHHGLGVLDFKLQRTRVKLGRKGVCRKTGGSSERKLMWRANLAPPRWEPGESRPQQREPLPSLALSLPQKEGFWFFLLCVVFKIQSLREAGAYLGRLWPHAFCPWTVEEYLAEEITRSTHGLPGHFSQREERRPRGQTQTDLLHVVAN